MAGLFLDLRYALRTLTGAPLLAGVAVLTMAVGIGANAAVFALVDTVLLRPLPYPSPGDIYSIAGTYDGRRREFVSVPDLLDWRASSRTFAAIAATRGGNRTIITPDGPEYLVGASVSADFFAVLGVQPTLGRAFAAAEFEAGHDDVVLIGHELWRRRFAGNPAIVGQAVVMDEEPVTVVGVMPPGFSYPDDSELWRPLSLVSRESSRAVGIVRAIGRVRAGVDVRQAQAELDTIAGAIAQAHPDTRAGWGVQVTPLHDEQVRNMRPTLLALWGAVGCVLLIACANITMLLLSLGLRRGPELAIRAALGAGRGRVVRQLIAEGLLIAAAGGGAGLALAWWGLDAFRVFQPAIDVGLPAVSLDWHVLSLVAGLSMITGILLGVAPARHVMRLDLQAILRRGGRDASASAEQRRTTRVFIAAQLALTLVLLVGAGLMVQTIARLQAVDVGFETGRLLTTYVRLPASRYTERAEIHRFYRELLDRLRVLPGVRDASAINALYVHWANAILLWPPIEGREPPSHAMPADTHVRIVAPGIDRVLGVPLIRGRSLTDADDEVAPRVVVINETMARRYFPGEDPIGHRVQISVDRDGNPVWSAIVGIVGDVRQGGLDAEPRPEILMPYSQTNMGQLALVIRTQGDPLALVPAVRETVAAMDPALPLSYVQTMDEVMAKALAPRRLGMDVLGGFAVVALALASVGVFAVVAAAVGARRRELAIRLAVGASPAAVFRMVLAEVALTAGAGLAAGVAVAYPATRALEPLLFGVGRADGSTYAVTVAVLLLAAIASGLAPARRSARVDPAMALRAE
ncbi:MAG: ABC transporter permease [Vicinamibacterales bacterium]